MRKSVWSLNYNSEIETQNQTKSNYLLWSSVTETTRAEEQRLLPMTELRQTPANDEQARNSYAPICYI
ncbi:hypothetical protein KY290_003419 [Solanum tuberosum]|uniref:Uncharacterized protein n=1 Tax=Solanum tuberosum TaxID=4113 RepID=A0ABQ7WSW5_SOLTU|nr:hypothetical protein KY284_003580 [Solanum tuberosum]KAH0732492.1 hypothetical protein KY289_003680 [Solanum tuberosum]KAH0783821.1 hypothetical protein KY290_003419 [Solanum tuberosum]